MTALKESLPPAARGPVGVGSLVVGIFGFTVGYILFVLGIMLAYDLAPQEVSTLDGLLVLVLGAALIGLGYAGLKGFMYFSY